MKIRTLSIAAGLLLLSFHTQSADINKEKALTEVKGITKAFAGALKTELVAAIRSGGPAQALEVCNTEAMPITTRIGDEQNADVFRVSLKNRNPDNVPNEW